MRSSQAQQKLDQRTIGQQQQQQLEGALPAELQEADHEPEPKSGQQQQPATAGKLQEVRGAGAGARPVQSSHSHSSLLSSTSTSLSGLAAATTPPLPSNLLTNLVNKSSTLIDTLKQQYSSRLLATSTGQQQQQQSAETAGSPVTHRGQINYMQSPTRLKANKSQKQQQQEMITMTNEPPALVRKINNKSGNDNNNNNNENNSIIGGTSGGEAAVVTSRRQLQSPPAPVKQIQRSMTSVEPGRLNGAAATIGQQARQARSAKTSRGANNNSPAAGEQLTGFDRFEPNSRTTTTTTMATTSTTTTTKVPAADKETNRDTDNELEERQQQQWHKSQDSSETGRRPPLPPPPAKELVQAFAAKSTPTASKTATTTTSTTTSASVCGIHNRRHALQELSLERDTALSLKSIHSKELKHKRTSSIKSALKHAHLGALRSPSKRAAEKAALVALAAATTSASGTQHSLYRQQSAVASTGRHRHGESSPSTSAGTSGDSTAAGHSCSQHQQDQPKSKPYELFEPPVTQRTVERSKRKHGAMQLDSRRQMSADTIGLRQLTDEYLQNAGVARQQQQQQCGGVTGSSAHSSSSNSSSQYNSLVALSGPVSGQQPAKPGTIAVPGGSSTVAAIASASGQAGSSAASNQAQCALEAQLYQAAKQAAARFDQQHQHQQHATFQRRSFGSNQQQQQSRATDCDFRLAATSRGGSQDSDDSFSQVTMLPGSMPWQCDVSIQCELLQAPPAVEPYETTGDVLNTIVRPFRGPPLNNYTATSFESNHHNHHHGHGHAHGHLSATLKRGLSAISQHHLSPVGAVSNCSAAGSMAINVVGNLRKSISNTFDAGKSLQGRPAAGAATASSSAALANSGGNKQGAPNNVHSPHHMFGLRSQDSLPAYSSLQNEPDDDSSLRSLDTLASCSSTGQSPRKLQLQLQQQHGGHIQASGSQSAGCEQQQQQAGLIGQLASKLTRQSSKKFTASKKGLQRALSFDYRGYKRLDGSQTGAGSAAASRAHHGHGTLVNSATLQASADSTASSTGSACSNNNNSLLAARHKPHNKSTLALQSPRPYLPQSASQVDFQVPLLPYERMQEAIVSQRLLEPPSVASASATGGGGGGQSNSAPPGSPCAPDSERKHHVTPVKQPDVDELICGGGPTVMQVETIKTTATTTSESGDNSYQSPGISSTQQQAGEQQERQRAGNHRRRTPPHEPPKLVLNIPAKSGRRLRYDPQLVGDANRDDDYDDDDDQEDGNANAGTGASSAVITCLPSPNVIIEPIFSETSLESSGEADDKSQQQQQQLLLLGNSRPGQMSQSPSFCIHPDGKTASFKHLGGGHNHNHDDNDDDNDDDNSACGNGSSSCQLGGANGLQSNLLTASDVFNNSKNFIKRPSTMMADVDGVEAMNQVVQALESKAASSRQQLTHSASVRSHNRRQAIVPPKLATDACMSPESETRDQPQVGKLVELADDDDGDGNNYDNEKRRVDKAVGGRSSRSAGRGVRSTRQTGGAGQLADEFGAEEEAEMSTLRRKRSGGGIEKAAPAVAPDKSHRRRQQNAANNGNADDGGLPTFSIEPDRDGNDIQSAGGQQQPIKGHECEPGGGGGDQQRARPDSQATNAESIVSSSSSTNLSAIGAGRFSANSATSGGLSVPFASGGSGSNQRRRSSIAVIPQMQICPGDLLVYSKQLIERMNQSDENEPPPFLKIDDKKGKNIWSSFKLCAQFDNRYMRARNELLCSLEDVLASLQPSTFVDEQLSHYKGMLWNEFLYETESRRSASSEIMNPDGDLNNNGNNEAGQDEAAGQDGWRVGARKKKSYRDDLVDVRISSPSPVSTSPSKVDGQQQQQQQHKRSGSMRANETRATGAPSATAAQAGHEAVKATMSSGNHASPGKPLPVSISSTGGGQQRALSSRFREKPKLKRGQTVDSVFRIPLIPSSPLKHAQQHQQTPTAHLEDLNTIEDDERSSVYSATSSTGAGTVAPSTSPRHSDARKRSSSTRSRSGSRPRQLATTCESPTSGAGGGESSKDVASPARAGKQLTSGTGSSNEKSQESSFDADDTNDLMYGGTGTGSGGAGKRGAGQMVRQTSLSTLSSTITRTEQKRQRALWDLFQSECTFFFDHLMTLKNVYMEPLKKIQVEGFAMFADPDVLFGNLDELCCGVYDFCKEFLYIIMRTLKTRPEELNATDVLIKLYKKNPKIDHLRAVYHRYTLNYINALTYLESLRRQVEFVEFEKWSSRDVRCKKLQLTDLLVAPVQHIMRVPIILKDIEAHTENLKDRDEIRAILAVEEASLRELDDKMRWLKNFERLLEIQKNISWPSVLDMDPKLYVPEFLKEVLSKQPCEKLIVSPRRQIVHEGTLSNFDLSGKASDMHVILFDDMLLMTRRKKCLTKKSSTVCKTNSAGHHGGVGCGGGSGSGGGAGGGGGGAGGGGGGGGSGGTGSHSSSSMMRDDGSYRYIVYKQPLSLDRFYVHDVQQVDSQSVGIKHLFLLIVMNRFQQIIGVHSFGAPNDDLKQTWLFKIKKTAERWKRNYSNSSTSNEQQQQQQQQQQQICTSKSMPMDALNGTTTCRRPHASSSKPTTRQPSSASGRFTGSKEATKLANTTRSMSDADEPSATVKYQSRQQHYESILSVTSDSGDTDRQSPAAGGHSRTSTPQQTQQQQQQQAIEFVITSASDSPAHNSSATPTIIAPGQAGQPSR